MRNVLQHLPAKHSNILQATFDDVRSGLRILFTLLECTAETEKASGLFIVTANVFALLLVTQPEDVWSLLRSSDVAFPLDQTTLVPVWGTKASPGRKNILLQDKILGRYGRTLACLELVQGLVKQAQWSVGTDQAPVREVKSSVLRRAMGWTLTCILPSYNSWKFADLRQKYEMGTRLASIIRDVLQETYSDPQGSLAGPFSIISQNLLFYPGHAQLSSIMDTISTGNETLSALQRLGKPADCHAIETCIHGHLQVVNRLLQISRISDTPGPILLERLLFAHESDSLFRSILPEARQDPIYMLIEYLVTCDVADIANEAAGILTKLCRLSIEWGRPSERPSLLSHLGSLRDTEAILRRFVELAGDPYGDLDLQLSTWRLLRAIAASQPGFSALLVTGHQTLEPETDSGPTAPEQDRAALGLALEVVYGWEEAWAVQPAILSAAITFLLELWQNYADSSKTLHAVRQEEKLWSALINIWNMSLPSSQSQAGSGEDSESSEVKQAHRRYAQAGVAALYAVELQITQTPPIHAPSGGLSISIKVFLNLVKNSTQLTAICQNAVGTSHADTEIRQIKDRLAPILLDVKLDSYVQPRLVDPAPYGPYFYYDSMVLAKRLIGSIGDLHSSSSKAVVALESIHQANIHWSRIDAESALLKATSTCLRVGLASMRLEEQSALSLQTACKTLLNSREAESSETAILEARYSGRLHLVLAMLEQLSRKHVECSKEFSSDLIRQLGVIVGNDAFPIDAFHTQSASGYASAIFKLIYHAFCMSSIHDASLSKKSIEPKCYESTEICLFACIKACNILIISAEDRNAGDAVAQNLSSVTSAISEILSSEMCPISISWLAYCDEVDFFRHCLDYITATDLCGNGLSIAHSILDLLLAMANDSRAAEKLALQGIVYSLCNNTLTEDLETGRLQDELPRSQDQSPGYSRHGIWILYLSLVNQLVCHLGKSQTFMEEEVTTFLQMYGKQVRRVLSWNATATIQLSEMHELRAVLSLLASLIKSSSEAGHLVPQSQDMLRSSLRTLPSFVYLLQHPNVLLSLVEATNPDQSLWLASEAVSSDAIDLGDLHNHLVVASLCQEVFSLCWLSVSTFVTYTSCFRILTRDRVDWPRDRAVIIAVSARLPFAKVGHRN